MKRLLLPLLLISLAAPACADAQGLPWAHPGAGLSQARQQDRILMLQVHKEGCKECEHMAADLAGDPELGRLWRQYLVPARLDMGSQQQLRWQNQALSEAELARKLLVVGTPTLILFSPEGRQLGRLIGYQSPQVVQGFLSRLINKYRQQKP